MWQRIFRRERGRWQRTSLSSRSHYLPLVSALSSSKCPNVRILGISVSFLCTCMCHILGSDFESTFVCLFLESIKKQRSVVGQIDKADISIKNQVHVYCMSPNSQTVKSWNRCTGTNFWMFSKKYDNTWDVFYIVNFLKLWLHMFYR